ncbi:MAG: hypothetical protein A2Y17_02260 [Clostridiales bacterium GWF2_38_85]|nr:MAG: hypothetical protein A2Y17_02260 [Clostridiales bacterium GWF2_38_85]HBL85024.1 hypothetical protein [Clostridiales bacterium]
MQQFFQTADLIKILDTIDNRTLNICDAYFSFIRNTRIRFGLYPLIGNIGTGSFVAYSLSQNGSETVMFEFTNGGIIGANLLFGDSGKYPLNIYCLTDCLLLHMTKVAVLELLKNYSFVMRYIQSLSQNSQ